MPCVELTAIKRDKIAKSGNTEQRSKEAASCSENNTILTPTWGLHLDYPNKLVSSLQKRQGNFMFTQTKLFAGLVSRPQSV